MNTMTRKKLIESDVPFFAWECLTIKLHHRDIDLVIRKES